MTSLLTKPKTLEDLWKEQEAKYDSGFANPKGGWELDEHRWSDDNIEPERFPHLFPHLKTDKNAKTSRKLADRR